MVKLDLKLGKLVESARAHLAKARDSAADGIKDSIPTKSECGDYNDIRSQAPSMRSQMSKSVGGNKLGTRVYHVDHSAKMNPTEEEWNNIV